MAQSHQVRKLELQVEVLKSLLNDGSREQLNADLEAWAQKLREEAIHTPQWQPENSDPFSFSATIIRAHEEESEHTVARGRLDSGCDEDWISTEILERAGLKPEIKATEIPMTYTAFGGQSFKPIGTIDITWYAVNAGLSGKPHFLFMMRCHLIWSSGRSSLKKKAFSCSTNRLWLFDRADSQKVLLSTSNSPRRHLLTLPRGTPRNRNQRP